MVLLLYVGHTVAAVKYKSKILASRRTLWSGSNSEHKSKPSFQLQQLDGRTYAYNLTFICLLPDFCEVLTVSVPKLTYSMVQSPS